MTSQSKLSNPRIATSRTNRPPEKPLTSRQFKIAGTSAVGNCDGQCIVSACFPLKMRFAHLDIDDSAWKRSRVGERMLCCPKECAHHPPMTCFTCPTFPVPFALVSVAYPRAGGAVEKVQCDARVYAIVYSTVRQRPRSRCHRCLQFAVSQRRWMDGFDRGMKKSDDDDTTKPEGEKGKGREESVSALLLLL